MKHLDNAIRGLATVIEDWCVLGPCCPDDRKDGKTIIWVEQED